VMEYEWMLSPAILSSAKNPEGLFEVKTLRLHLLDLTRQNESIGYVEQRWSSSGDRRYYFLTVLRGDRINDQRIPDMRSGMDILDLVSRERKADE
jgi:hypothetical protein